MISYVSTVVVAWRSSVGGSPIVATLRTPPLRGFSCAGAAVANASSSTAAATAMVLFMAGRHTPAARGCQDDAAVNLVARAFLFHPPPPPGHRPPGGPFPKPNPRRSRARPRHVLDRHRGEPLPLRA